MKKAKGKKKGLFFLLFYFFAGVRVERRTEDGVLAGAFLAEVGVYFFFRGVEGKKKKEKNKKTRARGL